MMATKGFSKVETIVGLDIGSSTVKMACFIKQEDGLYLSCARIRELEKTGDPASYDREVVSALRELFTDPALKKATIVVNINCPQTSIKKMTAPLMPPGELREAIKLGAKSQFSFPVDESLMDFEITGEVVDKGVKKYEIVVAACPKKTSDRYMALLDQAGIQPSSFISTSYALQKIAGSISAKSDKARCFIDIGDSCTEMVIAKGKRLLFTRKIPVAGAELTKALTQTLTSDRGKVQLSPVEAEKVKREAGIPAEGETKVFAGKITAIQVLSVLRSPLEHLINETERCFEYYRESGLGDRIESVVLFGGGAALGGLVKYMAEALGVDVALGNCLEGMKIDSEALRGKEEMPYRLELAAGAALSATEGIDLLPSSIKKRELAIVVRRAAVAVAVVVAAISLAVYLGMAARSRALDKKIAQAKVELAGLQEQLKKIETLAVTSRVLANEPRWEEAYTELANLMPGSVYIRNLSMRNNVLTFRGVVEGDDAERIISNFILALEKGIFSSVKLIGTKKIEKSGESEFELSCWIDYEK